MPLGNKPLPGPMLTRSMSPHGWWSQWLSHRVKHFFFKKLFGPILASILYYVEGARLPQKVTLTLRIPFLDWLIYVDFLCFIINAWLILMCIEHVINDAINNVLCSYINCCVLTHWGIVHAFNAIWWHRTVNIGSGNGLLPDGTKPLPELMLTYHQ